MFIYAIRYVSLDQLHTFYFLSGKKKIRNFTIENSRLREHKHIVLVLIQTYYRAVKCKN